MSKPTMAVVPLLIAALLGGCTAPVPDLSDNSVEDLQNVIDLIPWAKSVAGDASTDQLSARIAEITAGLPSLDIPDATRTEVGSRLKVLSAAVLADPSNAAAHATELNAIIDEMKAAVEQLARYQTRMSAVTISTNMITK
jgi:hypothetical protein